MSANITARFREDYAAHRAAEGRAYSSDQLHALPYLTDGPLAKQWRVRARTFDFFMESVLRPAASAARRPLRILDLGAGNAWLSWRVVKEGHDAIAIDVRTDTVDGLGAAHFPQDVYRVAAGFDELPVPDALADIVVFNASLHYALDLTRTLAEAARVLVPNGMIAILDSPFYKSDVAGTVMVVEKRMDGAKQFGEKAGTLLDVPFIEFLTRERLAEASAQLGLQWQRHKVRYPLWYELRPLSALLRGRRAPSRFDVWIGTRA